MKQLILIVLMIFLGCESKSQNQEKVVTHITEYTTTDLKLITLNSEPEKNQSFVKESIDEKGRTIKLEFYNWNKELDWPGSGFWGGPIIKYKYEERNIIETFFWDDDEIANDFKYSEVPFRFIYILDDDNNLIDLKSIYKIDFEYTIESLDETIKHLELYKSILDNADKENELDKDLFDPWYVENVFGYNYATGKLNGKHPTRKR